MILWPRRFRGGLNFDILVNFIYNSIKLKYNLKLLS